ncbi:hypothetical protein NSMM_480024 [Nitrosomonas mobilis]|uniref:Transposase n=1 Tax=Nitrosomonas mobilis TaxID=51642 RepID=A0A1G5SFY3_9PROT|nr:hypothetical protein NSMM_480024 [Nitrosomonas mobilis]
MNYRAALIEGLTMRTGARQYGIDKNTSFRWHHRFLALPAATAANRLQGIIEVDETFFPLSCKGQLTWIVHHANVAQAPVFACAGST